jgi:nicotinate-nucleotide adenylyltransferase
MKIGLLGGSFNPVHNGHLKIAQAALKQNFVQQVWFIPSYIHPLKDHLGSADFSKRFDLIKKAIIPLPECQAYDFEKRSKNPSYTQKLMQYLYQEYPQYEFHFMIGYDIIPELHKWYNYDWLKDNLNFLIITRTINDTISAIKELKHYQFLNIPPIDISSTQIRNLIRQGKSIHGLVPENIEPDIIEIYR